MMFLLPAAGAGRVRLCRPLRETPECPVALSGSQNDKCTSVGVSVNNNEVKIH